MKCVCKDCGKVIDQEAMQPALIVNSADPEHCYVLCEECRSKRGFSIVVCAHCTEMVDASRLKSLDDPAGFTPCPSCGKDIYTGKAQEEYQTVRCRKCGSIIKNPDEDARTINEGTANEYIVCEPCFDSMWDLNEITKCEGCGRWYDNGVLSRDPKVDDFVPCPVCGMDVVEGYSRKEAEDRMLERQPRHKSQKPRHIPDYRENAEAVIFELANIISENHRLRKENNDLRLRLTTLEALCEGLRTNDYDKYEFLLQIQQQNDTFDLHRASGWVSNVEYVDDWEQKLADFMAKKNKEKFGAPK